MGAERNLELAVLGSFITFRRLLRQNVAPIPGSLWDKLIHRGQYNKSYEYKLQQFINPITI